MHALRLIAVTVLLVFVLPLAGQAANIPVSKTDKCPVCGMFVAKYPGFLAQIIFTDGTYAVFDGPKDMFKYFHNLKKYSTSKSLTDITSIYVTDYYSMKPVDGQKAWYVIGSDVFGPMGHELIPFAQKQDANVFMKDHAGKTLIQFDAVTPALIKSFD